MSFIGRPQDGGSDPGDRAGQRPVEGRYNHRSRTPWDAPELEPVSADQRPENAEHWIFISHQGDDHEEEDLDT
jgi:hypothetical protein